MQMRQLSLDNNFHGRVRRISKHVLRCLVVFPGDEHEGGPRSSDALSALMVVLRSLPEFDVVDSGLCYEYSYFLSRPFQVTKTISRFIDEHGNSDEPENAISEIESTSGASSHN